MSGETGGLDELLIAAEELEWREKSLPGLSEKRLWSDAETEASIALVRFEQGAGIPERHEHASNQFMFCLAGEYEYVDSGLVLRPGSFYWNPKGNPHGPTVAREESILLEIYDGPHYPQRPSWYSRDEDAR
jgi:quercetin dioxygenase-like cupin family protein